MSSSSTINELRRLVADYPDLLEAVQDAIIDSGCAHRLAPGAEAPEPAWLAHMAPEMLRRLADTLVRAPGWPLGWPLTLELLGLELLERIAQEEQHLPAATLMQRLMPTAPPDVVVHDGPDRMIEALALLDSPRYGVGVRDVIVAYASQHRNSTNTTKTGP